MSSGKKRKLDRKIAPEGFALDPAIAPLRVVMPVANRNLVEQDLADTFRALGHQVMRLPYRFEADRAVFEGTEKGEGGLANRVMKFGPHLIVCVNAMGLNPDGILPGLAEAEGAALVAWFVDAPTLRLPRALPPEIERLLVLTYDKAHIGLFRQMGYSHVEHLPLGASLSALSAAPKAASEGDIAVGYVGNLFAGRLEQNARWLSECVRIGFPGSAEAFEALRHAGSEHFTSQSVPHEPAVDWIRREAGEWIENPERLFEPVGRFLPPAQYLWYLIAYGAASRQRQALARELSAQGLHVWGESAWRQVVAPARCHGSVPYESLGQVYGRCRVNLSISHVQNIASVTQRLFDVPASGGFLLSDWRACMSDLFEPGEELIVFHTPEEASELAGRYAKDAEARSHVVRRARRRIEAEHTMLHRVEALARLALERWPEVADRPRRRKTVAMASPPEVAARALGCVALELARSGLDRAAQPIRAAMREAPGAQSEIDRVEAVRASETGDYARALALWRGIIEGERGSSHAAHFAAGNASLRAEGPEAALAYFREATRLRPLLATYWTSIAGCHLQMEDWGRARGALERALDLEPDHAVAREVRDAFRDEIEGAAPICESLGEE